MREVRSLHDLIDHAAETGGTLTVPELFAIVAPLDIKGLRLELGPGDHPQRAPILHDGGLAVPSGADGDDE